MKLKITFFYLTLLLFYSSAFSQTEFRRFIIKGQIFDKKNNKPIARFPITIKEFKRTVISNERGEFLFNMPENTYTFIFDDYPYIKKEQQLKLTTDTTVTVTLETIEGVHSIQEVVIVTNKVYSEYPSSITKIGHTDLVHLPAMMGEADLLKVLALNAGVSSSGEGAADIQVRGGTQGQNLFLLDKIPLYSTQHMLGMISVYNPTTIKTAELYKAGFPAEYGGRIASVLDVKTKDPNLSKFGGDVEISLLSTKVSLDIPLLKNKLGLTVAGRISNYSLLNLISLSGISPNMKMNLHFADLNTALLYKPSLKDQIKLTIFHNSDGLYQNQADHFQKDESWLKNKQQNIVLNWDRKLSEKTVNSLWFFVDSYKFNFGTKSSNGHSQNNVAFDLSSNISSGGLGNKIEREISSRLSANAGIEVKINRFSPLTVVLSDTIISSGEAISRLESSLFAQTKYKIRSNENIDVGVRFSTFGNLEKPIISLEPRISYRKIICDNLSISASASRMTQNIHRVANPGVGVGMELFQPSDNYLKPEKSWVFSMGISKDIKYEHQSASIKADAWYKKMWNLVEFKDGYDAVSIMSSENKLSNNNSEYLTQGNGQAYGIDVSGLYTFSKFNLSVDYTLMEARNRFDELNNGKWFAASTDIRHCLSLTNEVRLRRNWVFTTTWQLRSGRPITLPTAIFPASEIDFNSGQITYARNTNRDSQGFQMIETERNNARMRAFHKLDISIRHTYLTKKKHTGSISFGIYNVYNRANPSYYFMDKKEINGTLIPVLKSVSMFPIMPSFSWGLKF